MWHVSLVAKHWYNGISTHTSRVGCDILPVIAAPLTGISTHTSRVGCDLSITEWISLISISTHTSRVGCDVLLLRLLALRKNFYSHIPCGMWLWCPWFYRNTIPFLLTHPVWDVTEGIRRWSDGERFLLTHPVWDVTALLIVLLSQKNISTHTSRVGCDTHCLLSFLSLW